MRLNVKEYDNHQALMFPTYIGDYLSNDHLAHVVDEAVEEINLSAIYRKISLVGNPAYHPALMVKIWFYGYATRTYSSRKIEERLNTDVAFIYLAGMQKPDFRTISDFRKNNLKELKELFVEILQICHLLGMVKLGEISLDSKVMKANASSDKSYTKKELIEERESIEKTIKEYLERVKQTDEEEDKKYGHDRRGDELPKEICNKEKRINKMRQVIEQLRKAEEGIRESGQKKVNLTDKDAYFQKDKTRILSGYRAQVAVDCKKQIIVTNDVTNKQNDAGQLISMVDKVLENIKEINPDKFLNSKQEEKAINIIADAGYSSGKNLAELEKEGYKDKVEAYIPDTNYDNKERGKGYNKDSVFHRSKFIYNKEENKFKCPDGKELGYMGEYIFHKVSYQVYKCKECRNCRYFGECTTAKEGRSISISEYQPYIDKMREKLLTQEGKKIYGLRKITAEPVIGNLSYNLGFREFLLRGLEKAKGEFSLMCIAHNILKINKNLKRMGITLRQALNLTMVQWQAIRKQELIAVMDTS